MGNNTTVVILNDYVGEIERSREFLAERLVEMLSSGETGQVIPGVNIIETHHADSTILVKVGGNVGKISNFPICNRCKAKIEEGLCAACLSFM